MQKWQYVDGYGTLEIPGLYKTEREARAARREAVGCSRLPQGAQVVRTAPLRLRGGVPLGSEHGGC